MERQTATKVQKTSTQNHSVQRQPAAPSSAGNRFIELQRSIGNQAAQRLINGPFIQAKLSVSSPGDPLEEEADQVADTVMRMPVTPGPSQTAPPGIQRKCDLCEGGGCAKCTEGIPPEFQAVPPTSDGPLQEDENKLDENQVSDAPPTESQPEGATTERVPLTEQSLSPAGTAGNQQSEAVSDAPSATYIVPFDRNPQAAPGERIIFRAVFSDPTPGDYQLEYSTTGGHFTSATGPTTRTIAGLTSGNVDFFVPAAWMGTTLQVVLNVRKISPSAIVQTETWNFTLKPRYPTTMTQRETTGERNLPGVYTYDIGPPLLAMLPPYYEHQTILEQFGNWTLANIVPADIDGAYRTANSLNSAADVSAHFLGNYAGNNGTFTVDANDRIADQHGGHPNLSNLVSKLVTPKNIEVALPQTYEARPGTALGRYTVTRIRKTDGTWKVKKG